MSESGTPGNRSDDVRKSARAHLAALRQERARRRRVPGAVSEPSASEPASMAYAPGQSPEADPVFGGTSTHDVSPVLDQTAAPEADASVSGGWPQASEEPSLDEPPVDVGASADPVLEEPVSAPAEDPSVALPDPAPTEAGMAEGSGPVEPEPSAPQEPSATEEPAPSEAASEPTPGPAPASDGIADDVEAIELSLEGSDLHNLPGAGNGLVWMLHTAGVTSIADLARADADALATELGTIARILDLSYWIGYAQSKEGITPDA